MRAEREITVSRLSLDQAMDMIKANAIPFRSSIDGKAPDPKKQVYEQVFGRGAREGKTITFLGSIGEFNNLPYAEKRSVEIVVVGSNHDEIIRSRQVHIPGYYEKYKSLNPAQIDEILDRYTIILATATIPDYFKVLVEGELSSANNQAKHAQKTASLT